MEWIKNLNTTITYIEAHLNQDIDYNTLAKIAGCPSYHFQKMFLYMTNISVSEYIRRRRMSLAAVELQTSKIKIIDLALKYGYESPTAFNRAFKTIHGIAPSIVRKQEVTLKSYPAIQFSVTIQGNESLNYQIIAKEAFSILGITCPLSKELLENFQNIPDQWQNAQTNGTLDKLIKLNNTKPEALLGVSVHQGDDWRYFIAVSSTIVHENFERYDIPKATWAIFKGQGTNKDLQELQRQVIIHWLPTSGYKYANIPDIEVYLKADPNDAIYEYWLPIIPNKEM